MFQASDTCTQPHGDVISLGFSVVIIDPIVSSDVGYSNRLRIPLVLE